MCNSGPYSMLCIWYWLIIYMYRHTGFIDFVCRLAACRSPLITTACTASYASPVQLGCPSLKFHFYLYDSVCDHCSHDWILCSCYLALSSVFVIWNLSIVNTNALLHREGMQRHLTRLGWSWSRWLVAMEMDVATWSGMQTRVQTFVFMPPLPVL